MSRIFSLEEVIHCPKIGHLQKALIPGKLPDRWEKSNEESSSPNEVIPMDYRVDLLFSKKDSLERLVARNLQHSILVTDRTA
jgi:hypothetical protein